MTGPWRGTFSIPVASASRRPAASTRAMSRIATFLIFSETVSGAMQPASSCRRLYGFKFVPSGSPPIHSIAPDVAALECARDDPKSSGEIKQRGEPVGPGPLSVGARHAQQNSDSGDQKKAVQKEKTI